MPRTETWGWWGSQNISVGICDGVPSTARSSICLEYFFCLYLRDRIKKMKPAKFHKLYRSCAVYIMLYWAYKQASSKKNRLVAADVHINIFGQITLSTLKKEPKHRYANSLKADNCHFVFYKVATFYVIAYSLLLVFLNIVKFIDLAPHIIGTSTRENLSSVLPTWSLYNQPAQLQRLAWNLKLRS